MVTAEQVDNPPLFWNPQGALNLPDMWFFVDRHIPSGLPMSVAVFVTICFEETACCNRVQSGTPAAIGPGQLQVSEEGKVDFFASKEPDNSMGDQWDTSMTIMAVNQATGKAFWRQQRLHPELRELTQNRILADKEFAIKMHLKFFQWLARGFADGKPKGLDGLLKAHTGDNNVSAVPLFKQGAAALEKLMQPDPTIDLSWSDTEWKRYFAKRRSEFIRALNTARRFRANQIPDRADFRKFWEFFLPDQFLEDPLGYIKWGF